MYLGSQNVGTAWYAFRYTFSKREINSCTN